MSSLNRRCRRERYFCTFKDLIECITDVKRVLQFCYFQFSGVSIIRSMRTVGKDWPGKQRTPHSEPKTVPFPSLHRSPTSKYDGDGMRRVTGDRDLYGGLIRLHVLHHAGEKPLYGHWMIEELRRHGYEIGPGTMYPLLHGLARKGYLRSKQ